MPVTDEMLRNPDPADWLMARRNYQAWSYSPLTQITPENVKHLQLAWVWAMNDGGANEPTPIVHDGIIYLTNTSNTLQALDGRTGELIWENRIGPESTRGYGAMRNLAIYDDKLFLTTTDARLYALDARTGKIVWQTAIADGKQGYSNTSGPIVINGKVLTGMTGCGRYGADCYISAYDARTGKQLWNFNTDRARRPARRRHLGQAAQSAARRRRDVDHRQLRSRPQPHLLGRRAGQTVDARQPRRQARRQGALHQLHAGARSRHRQAEVVLPACARRVARPGRSLRARAGRSRREQAAVHHRQARHPVEARSRDRQVSRLTRKRSSRTSSPASIPRPASRPTAATSWSSRSASGCRSARAPRAATTGRR